MPKTRIAVISSFILGFVAATCTSSDKGIADTGGSGSDCSECAGEKDLWALEQRVVDLEARADAVEEALAALGHVEAVDGVCDDGTAYVDFVDDAVTVLNLYSCQDEEAGYRRCTWADHYVNYDDDGSGAYRVRVYGRDYCDPATETPLALVFVPGS